VSNTDQYTALLLNLGLMEMLGSMIPTLINTALEPTLHLLSNLTCTDAPPGAIVQRMLDAGIFAAAKNLGRACIHPVRLNRAYLMGMATRSALLDQLTRLVVEYDLMWCLGEGLLLHDTATATEMLGHLGSVFMRMSVLGMPSPAVVAAREADIHHALYEIANVSKTKTIAEAAQKLLDKYFPDYEEEQDAAVTASLEEEEKMQKAQMEREAAGVAPMTHDEIKASFMRDLVGSLSEWRNSMHGDAGATSGPTLVDVKMDE